MLKRNLVGLLSLFLVACAQAEERPLFFAMDTAARQPPAEAALVLAELGYDGFGGSPATAKAYATELATCKVRFVNAYHVTKFSFQDTAVPADLVQAIDALAGLDTTLWLGLQQVELSADVNVSPTSGDAVAVPALKRALALAKAKGVKISLTHTQAFGARAWRRACGWPMRWTTHRSGSPSTSAIGSRSKAASAIRLRF